MNGNGYKVSAEETELYVDKLAAVAASTAADLEELSTGMSRVASAANLMGVDIDQLNAQLATIVSVTRQAPESVGVALRSIYARMSDIQAGLDEETTLDNYTEQMAQMGINVLDSNNKLRDMGEVVEEVGEKWKTMSREQQIFLAQAMAGTRQYNNLLALFDNWDMYTDAIETSANAMGTLQHQQDIYMESASAHLKQLKAEAEKTYDVLLDADMVKDFADALNSALTVFNNFLEGIGGGANDFIYFGSLLAGVFNNQIGRAIERQIENVQAFRANLGAEDLKQQIIAMHAAANEDVASGTPTEIEIESAREISDLNKTLTAEQANQLTNQQRKLGLIEQEIQDLVETKDLKDLITDNTIEENESTEHFLDRRKKNLDDIKQKSEAITDSGKDSLNLLNDYNGVLYENLEIESSINPIDAERARLTDSLYNIRSKLNTLGLEDLTIQKAIETLESGNNLTSEQIVQLKEAINQALSEQKILLGDINTLSDKNLAIELIRKKIAQETAQIRRQENISNVVQGVASLVNLLTSLSGIIKTLNDDTLSTEEKVERIISTLLLQLPIIISNITSIKRGIDGITSLISNAGGWSAIISKIGTAIAGVGNAANGASAAVAGAGAAIQGAGAASASAAGGVLSFGAALSSILATAGLFAIVLGTVGAGLYVHSKQQNADLDAMKKSAEQAEKLKESHTELAQTYQELNSEMEKYSNAWDKVYGNAKEGIEALTEGTDEYKEAVKEANAAALELINSNGELAQYASYNTKGLIEFTDGYEDVLKKAEDRANTSGSMADLAQVQNNYDTLKYERTQLARDYGIGSWNEMTHEFVELDDESLQALVNRFLETGSLITADIEEIVGTENQLLVDSIEEAVPAIKELAQKTAELTAKNELLIQNALRQSLESDTTYAGFTDAQKNAFAELYGRGLTEDKLAELRAQTKTYSDGPFGLGEENDLHKKYAELANVNFIKDKIGDTAVYQDKVTGETFKVSDDDARAYVTNQELAEKLKDYDKQTKNNLLTLIDQVQKQGEKVNEDFANELLGFLTGEDTSFDITEMTQETLDQIRDLMENNGEGLETLFGNIVSPEVWKSAGYDDARSFVDALQEGFNNIDWNDYYTNQYHKSMQNQSDISSIISSRQSGEELSEDQLEALQRLTEQYEELADTRNLSEHEYLDLLRKVQEQEENNAKQALESNRQVLTAKLDGLMQQIDKQQEVYNSLSDDLDAEAKKDIEIDLIAKTEQVEETIQQLQDNDYKIQLQIEADLQTDVDQAFGLASEIESLRNAVIDDLTITFQEAQDLISQGYGAMLENAKAAADGMIEVDKDVMNNFVDNRQAELEADRQAKIAQLQNERAILEAQRTILEQKLAALSEAAAADNDIDAANAVAKAARYQADYNAKQEELQQILNGEAETATETSKINAELFSDLSTMYQTDSENIQNAESVATDQQSKEIATRIENVRSLYNAYCSLANAVRSSALGIQPGPFLAGGVKGGGGTDEVPIKPVESDQYTPNDLEDRLDEIREKAKELWNENNEEFQATIEASKKDTQQRIDDLTAQMGTIDSGVAALESASFNLDKAQSEAQLGGKDKGGGGSKEKEAKDPDFLEYLEDEADRYHDINIQLDILDHSLQDVKRDQDKLMGQKLLDNLNTQLDLLERQKAVYENKIRLEQEEADMLKESLSAQGVVFGPNNAIANYTQALQTKLDYVNGLIDTYNAMSAEEQEAFKETIDAAKEEYEQLKSDISRYDTVVFEEIPELQDQIQDAFDEQIEINIKKFNAEIEIRLDMEEAERDFNEFRRKVLDEIKDDDILGNARADLRDFYSYFDTFNTGIGPIQALTEQVNKTREEYAAALQGNSAVYGDNAQQAYEDLMKYNEELMTHLEELQDLAEQIRESYLDMIDQMVDDFEDHVDQYEYINDLLNHDLELIGLMYGDDAYAGMDKYYRAIEENNNNELRFLRERVDYANRMMKEETNPEARKKWIEEWENSLSELNKKVEESVQNIIDKYTNAINAIFDKLNDKVTGGLGLDYVNDEWDLLNRNAEQYLDDINAMQGIQDLENKFLDAMENADDLASQQKLKDVMEEQLGYLREKDRLTQYDVDRANMVYEITLKQLALEAAQQSKTDLRLRRDAQGNYRYEYVADEEEIEEKRQELLDAQADLYNFDKEQYIQNLNDIYDAYVEYQEKLKELRLDNTIDEEERLRREQLLNEQYGELLNGLVEENLSIRDNLQNSAFDALASLYAADAQNFWEMTQQNLENFKNMTEEERNDLMENLVPQWDSSVQHMADTFAAEGGLIPTCEEAFAELSETTYEYQNDLSELEDAAGVTFDSLQDGISDTQDALGELSTEGVSDVQDIIDENSNLVDQYANDLIPAIQGVIQELDAMIQKYDGVLQAAKNAATAAYEFAQAQQAANAAVQWQDNYTPQAYSDIPSNDLHSPEPATPQSAGTGSSGGGSSSGGGGTGGSSSKKQSQSSSKKYSDSEPYKDETGDFIGWSERWYSIGQSVTFDNMQPVYAGHASSSKSRGQLSGRGVILAYYPEDRLTGYPVKFRWNNGQTNYLPISAFKSGGYTGEWAGDQGRLAMLHEKELVLNNQDTSNILTAVAMVRDMNALLSNLNGVTHSYAASMFTGLGQSPAAPAPAALDQNVHIEASFPNVRDSREIEEALTNLVNAASMHAFNSRR